MFELVLTSAERTLLEALNALGVRYLIVGMGAALIEGAPGTTQDLDLWFGRIDPEPLREAARKAGGLYTSGFGLQPPAIGGEGLERVDLVLTASGLESFETEFRDARSYDLDGVRVRVLPLERVIASKRAAKRPKDSRTQLSCRCSRPRWRLGEPETKTTSRRRRSESEDSRQVLKCALRNRPVCDTFVAAISSGVPVATTFPPAWPPSGPRSITWSAVLITSR